MGRKNKELTTEAKKVLKVAFNNDVNTLRDTYVRDQVIEYIQTQIMPENNDLSYKLAVDDNTKKVWRKSEHFMKTFWFEVDHLTEYYSLSSKARHFMFDIGKFLMWETNLLVDDEDNPLNQKSIAEKLEIDVSTVRRNMKELKEKFVIHEIVIWNKTYYMVNPYVMFCGREINQSINKLFIDLGYKDSNTVNKKARVNRRKKKETLLEQGFQQ